MENIEKRIEKQINIIIDRYEKLEVSLNDVKKYLTGRNISTIIDELSELEIIYLNRNKDKDSKDFKKLVRKLINDTIKDRRYSYMDKVNEAVVFATGHGSFGYELEQRLNKIVDNYKKRGMTNVEIRMHFLDKKNFNKILHVFHDLEAVYNQNTHAHMKFENLVYDVLFYRVLLERVDKPDDEWYTSSQDDTLDENMKYIKSFKVFEDKNEN